MIVHKRGKGIVRYRCHNRYTKRSGSGFFDFLKPVIGIVKGIATHKDTISKVVSTAKDVYNVGQNTKDIIQSIRKPKPAPISNSLDQIEQTANLENIVNRISNLRTTSGASLKKRNLKSHTGQGFAYV